VKHESVKHERNYNHEGESSIWDVNMEHVPCSIMITMVRKTPSITAKWDGMEETAHMSSAHFPETIVVDSVIYRIRGSSSPRVQLYQSLKNRIVGKLVNLDSGELDFHRQMREGCNNQWIFVAPLRIIHGRNHAILVYPFRGIDALRLAQSRFWPTDENITLSFMHQLIDKLHRFHKTFGMGMGDIKPDNIVYDGSTGVASYIDLEYVTAQYVLVETVSPPVLSIVLPDLRTRHYRTVTTPCYTCYEKRLGRGSYCVFKNDAYALATTIFCLLTNRQPPGFFIGQMPNRSTWDSLHTQEFKELVVEVQTVLAWCDAHIVLEFVRIHWSVPITCYGTIHGWVGQTRTN
jgi:serine/threonine protein kinase